MAAIFTHTDIKEEDLLGGDEINMCVAMNQLFQRMRNEGESIGIKKVRQEEKQSTLKELLKVKLGTLSSKIIIEMKQVWHKYITRKIEWTYIKYL